MDTIIIAVILAAIIGLAAFYVYKAKKSGQKCIGCPSGGQCAGAQGGKCSCGCSDDNTNE